MCIIGGRDFFFGGGGMRDFTLSRAVSQSKITLGSEKRRYVGQVLFTM